MTAFEARMRRRARLSAFAKILFVVFALSSMAMGAARACRSLERSRGDVTGTDR